MQQAVCGILFENDKKNIVLIQRRDIPVWVLPGGGLEPHESPEEGVVRELLEETGYEVRILYKIADYLPVNKMTQRTHFYACSAIQGSPTSGPETKAVRSFALDALPPLPPPYPHWIRDALSYQGKPLCKKIEGVTYLILLKLLIQHPILVGQYLLTKMGWHCNRKW